MLDNRNFFCLFFNSLTIGKDESDLPAHSGGARSEASLGWNTIEKHYHHFRWDFWSIPSINYQFKLIWWHYLLPMTPLDWQRLTLTHSWIFKRVWRHFVIWNDSSFLAFLLRSSGQTCLFYLYWHGSNKHSKRREMWKGTSPTAFDP